MDRTSVFQIIFSATSVLLLMACSGTRPPHLGVTNGKLAPCPSSPNCVSSQSSDKEHAVEPLTFTSPPLAAMASLKTIVLSMPRTALVTETPAYLHVEFTSAIMRFVDDVEFYLDETAHAVHIRSASRLGHSDMGVNRKRVEEIRSAWKKAQE